MKLVLLFLPLLLVSCVGGPRYSPTTSETGYLYHKAASPLAWFSLKEMHTSVETVDGLISKSASPEVDTGKRTIGVLALGPGQSYRRGTLVFEVEKDAYYYIRCRRAESGEYRFTCETDFDDGDEETDAVRLVASAPALPLR
jgi:hypothetical protein